MARNIVLSKEDIEAITARVGKEISEAIKDSDKIPVFIGVLKGSVNFMMDLIKHIDLPIYTDYIQIQSYHGTSSTGKVQLLKDVSYDCEDRDVVIVEDIVDTGLSMDFLINHIKTHHPRRIYVCSLLDKANARKVPVKVDFVGKKLEKNDFLIGYGLDYLELERNLPYIYAATKEDVEQLDKVLEKDKKN